MNSKIKEALTAVTALDSWDIQSTLGGVNFIVRQAALNTVTRLLPDPPPEGSGVEYFTRWEQQQKDPEIRKQASPFVGLADEVTAILLEHTTAAPTDYAGVLQFMTERPPVRENFVADYNRRKQLGMRPQMPIAEFVNMEYQTAMQRHAQLIARGENAVQVLDSVEGSDESAPEWLETAVMDKIQSKLEQRWMRAEMRRTNPRVLKQQRDEAEANQRLIESVATKLGFEKPNYVAEMEADDEMEAVTAKINAMSPKP